MLPVAGVAVLRCCTARGLLSRSRQVHSRSTGLASGYSPNMDWGDVPAWAAFILSGVAIVVTWKARGDGKRSADASERSAAVAEAALAEQRAEAEERRRKEEEADRPRVELLCNHVTKDLYRLANEGTAPARNITFHQDDLPAVFRLNDGDEVSLNPGEAVDFLMAGSWGKPVPPQLFACWEGQDTPVPVRVTGIRAED